MILQVRTARPSIEMDGTDYFQKLSPYFLNMSVEDNCDGKKADDLEIKLADRDKRFINDWMPKKGAFLDIGIIAERWFSPIAGAMKLDCGRFWIDSIEFSLPDHTVSVKANSIPTDIQLKAAVASRGWDDGTLKDIAGQIAKENKMDIEYPDDIGNPKYVRTEQHDESQLEFLQKRAANAKLAIKVHKNKIIFYDEQKMEDAAPKFAILYGNVAAEGGLAAYRMAGGTFTTTVVDKVKKAKVKHVNVETGETEEGEAEDQDEDGEENGGNGEAGSAAEHNISEDTDAEDDSSDSIGDPSREVPVTGGSATQWNAQKAKAVVRDKNKHKYLGKVDLSIGNPLIASGMTLMLKGVGQYDGKWFVESCHHEVGPEFKTELTIRRCLKGL
jgi:phage protein D